MNNISSYLPTDFPHSGRLFHGRGKSVAEFNWLNIDSYFPLIYVVLYKELSDHEKEKLSHLLLRKYNDVQNVLFSNERVNKELVISEGPLKFLCKLGVNKNTGVFFESSSIRDWVLNNSEDCSVLNLFSYTCTIGVAAKSGKAKKVINIDSSNSSLEWGKKNYELNSLDKNSSLFLKKDIRKYYKKIGQKGPFDLIVADPPPRQAKSFCLKKDYEKLLSHIPNWLNINGKVILCKNDTNQSISEFRKWIIEKSINLKIIQEILPPKAYRYSNPEESPCYFILEKSFS